MGLRIIYGESGTGKTEYCFKEMAKRDEKNIFIITPEQFSFTAERKLMENIESQATMNKEVITLSRMAYRVLNEVGGKNTKNLTKCGKAMLIYSILSKNKKKLKFLGKSEDNIDLSITAITEFKKHGIGVEDLYSEIEETEDKYLKTKLEDMALVYENFENKIKGEYIEETDLLTILANSLESVEWIKGSVVYIDEFSGFTYQEYQVLKELIRLAKQVNITICIDELNYAVNPDIDIYYSNKITLTKLLHLVDENNLQLEEPVLLENKYRFKTRELKHLSDNLYNIKSTKYEENVDNISLFLAKNEYSEIEEVAKKIKKLVREENFKYRDISIITKSLESYSPLVRAIFKEYEIPVFIDEKRDLNQNIIVQYVLSIVEILSRNFSTESIFNYLKLGFLDFGKEEIFKFENYCNKWGIKQNKFKKDFNIEVERENQREEIQRLNELRKEIITPLVKLQMNIKENKTAKGIVISLYRFLKEQNIEGKLKSKILELEKEEKRELASEYKTSYEILINIFDEIVNVFNNDEMTIDQFGKILKIGLSNNGLGKIPGTQDQVILGDVDRSRSHKVKAVFIIGLNDGVFPSNNKSEGFFNDKDREKLKDDGLELAKGTIEQIYEEKLNIYKTFTTSEERLYLSYASSNKEGKALRPSILINNIKKLFPKLKEESDVITKKYEILNKKVTYEELIENIAKIGKKEKIENIWYEIYKYYKNQNEWDKRLKEDLEGLNYTNIPEKIKKENIQKLYGNTLNTSISKLEKFRSCPFSYYLQYGLKLKEKEQLKIQSFNTGSFMHETIDSFFEYVKDEKLALAELEDEDILKIVSTIIEDKLKLTKNYIFVSTAKYKVLVKRLKKIVTKALKYIIETITHSDFSIEGTEVEFGKNGKYKPIILDLEDGKKVEIIGKIDRVDTANKEDGKYLRIIDYKSSVKNIDLNEVYAGLQIQLLTYTDAMCKKEDLIPAGIFYFSLLEPMINADSRMDSDKIEEELRKRFKMKGLIIADVKIIKMNDNTLESGVSKIVPAGINKSGTVAQNRTNGVTSEEFKVLQDYIYKTIKDISREILNGKIDLNPYYKKGKGTPCEYCEYKSICGFKPGENKEQYNYILEKTKDEVIMQMKKDLGKE